MKSEIVRRVQEYLESWTQEDVSRLEKGAAHGNEEHLRFATIVLSESSKKLEKLTLALLIATIILAFLTAVLTWRTFTMT